VNNLFLYGLTVLIWGSTWIGIKYQLGVVEPMASVAHRFFLSTVLLFAYLLLRQRRLRFPLRDHGVMLLQGLCLFCINYYFVYISELTLSSGLVAVVFSNLLIFNILNGALFLQLPVHRQVLLGALLGLVGMVAVFWPELEALDLSDENFVALLCCLAGTWFASSGNILAVYLQRRQIPVLAGNAYGMMYGSLAMYLAAWLLGVPVTIDRSPVYLGALVYLSVFGSIIAFWAYITLIGRIGADRAGYSNLLYPLVALLISTLVESYQWSFAALLGVGLVLLGNWLVMRAAKG
jgi:drug/metabolite transporter (DMT)-like permease